MLANCVLLGLLSEIPIPAGELFFCLCLIKRETIKVDVAGALKMEKKILVILKMVVTLSYLVLAKDRKVGFIKC